MTHLCSNGALVHTAGCYFPIHNRIYVSKNTNNLESVFIHEIMHAVWQADNLNNDTTLHSMLQTVYFNHFDQLQPILDVYRQTDPYFGIVAEYNELHSFVATHIQELPTELEAHYQTILVNRKQFIEQPSATNASDNITTIQNTCTESQQQVTCLEEQYQIDCKEMVNDLGRLQFNCFATDNDSRQKVDYLLCESILVGKTEFQCKNKNDIIKQCIVNASLTDAQVEISCTNTVNFFDRIVCFANNILTDDFTDMTCYNLNSIYDEVVSCTAQESNQMTCTMPQNTQFESSFVSIIAWVIVKNSTP